MTTDNKRIVDCTMCDDTGFKDHAWLRMEPCDHQRPAREEVSGEEVERVAKAIHRARFPATYTAHENYWQQLSDGGREKWFAIARAAIAAMSPKPAEAASAAWEVITHYDAKDIAASAVQSACESDPADPEHPDTICISTDDFETIVHCAVTNWAEAKAIGTPATEKAVEPVNVRQYREEIAQKLFEQRQAPYSWEDAEDEEPESDAGSLRSICFDDADAVIATIESEMLEDHSPAADVADLLTKAIGDITAALILADKKDKIVRWTSPYVQALNEFDADRTKRRGHNQKGNG